MVHAIYFASPQGDSVDYDGKLARCMYGVYGRYAGYFLSMPITKLLFLVSDFSVYTLLKAGKKGTKAQRTVPLCCQLG